jgi:hypothetical protein
MEADAILKNHKVKLFYIKRNETRDSETHSAMIHESDDLSFDSARNPDKYRCSFAIG